MFPLPEDLVPAGELRAASRTVLADTTVRFYGTDRASAAELARHLGDFAATSLPPDVAWIP
jgi:hypothetical protein